MRSDWRIATPYGQLNWFSAGSAVEVPDELETGAIGLHDLQAVLFRVGDPELAGRVVDREPARPVELAELRALGRPLTADVHDVPGRGSSARTGGARCRSR